MFRNPVTLETGHTYEKDAIDEWLQQNTTDPTTNVELSLPDLRIPALEQRNQVQQWLQEHPDVSAHDLGWETLDLPPAQSPVVPAKVQAVAIPTNEELQEMQSELKCPMSWEYMRDPVILSDGNNEGFGGNTYERRQIVQHLRRHKTDPMTNITLSQPRLTINRAVRNLMQRFLDDHPNFTPESWPNREIPPPLLNSNIFDCINRADLESVRTLLLEGEDVNNTDRHGNFAIGYVVNRAFCGASANQESFKAMFDLLIDKNANVNVSFKNVNQLNPNFTSGHYVPLVRLCVGSVRSAATPTDVLQHILKTLLEKGCQLTSGPNSDVWPLEQAVLNKNLPFAELLLPRENCTERLGKALLASTKHTTCFEFGKQIMAKLLSKPWNSNNETLHDEKYYYFTAIQNYVEAIQVNYAKYMLEKYMEFNKAAEIQGHFGLSNCFIRAIYNLSGKELKKFHFTKDGNTFPGHVTDNENKEAPETKYMMRKLMKLIMKYDPQLFITHSKRLAGWNLSKLLTKEDFLDERTGLLLEDIPLPDHSSLCRSIKTGKLGLANFLIDNTTETEFSDIGHCIIALMLRGDFENNEILFDSLLQKFNWEDQLGPAGAFRYPLTGQTILTKALSARVDERYIHALIDAAVKAGKKEYLEISNGKDESPLSLCEHPSGYTIATRLIQFRDRQREIPLELFYGIMKNAPFGIFILNDLLKSEKVHVSVLNELLFDAIKEKKYGISEYLFEKGARLSMSRVASILENWNDFHNEDYYDHTELIKFQKDFDNLSTILENAFTNCHISEIFQERTWKKNDSKDGPKIIMHGNILHFICRFPGVIYDIPRGSIVILNILQTILSKKGIGEWVNQKCKLPGDIKFSALQLACQSGLPVRRLLKAGAHAIPRGALWSELPLSLAFDRLSTMMKKVIEEKKADDGIIMGLSVITSLLNEPYDDQSGSDDNFLVRSLRLLVGDFKQELGKRDIDRRITPLKITLQGMYMNCKDFPIRIDHVYPSFTQAEEVKLCKIINKNIDLISPTDRDWTDKSFDNLIDKFGMALLLCVHAEPRIGVPIARKIINDGFGLHSFDGFKPLQNREPHPIFARIILQTIEQENTEMFDYVMDIMNDMGIDFAKIFKKDLEPRNLGDMITEKKAPDPYNPLTHCIFRIMEILWSSDHQQIKQTDEAKLIGLRHILSRSLSVTKCIPAAVVHALFTKVHQGRCTDNYSNSISLRDDWWNAQWHEIRKTIFAHPGFNINAVGYLHLCDQHQYTSDTETVISRSLQRPRCAECKTPEICEFCKGRINEILDLGGNVNIGCGSNKYTPLHHIVLQSRYNDQAVLSFVWKKSQQSHVIPPDTNVTDKTGNTLLHFAQDKVTAKALLTRGAKNSLGMKNEFGQTPSQFWTTILKAFDDNQIQTCEAFIASGFREFKAEFTKPRLKRIRETVANLDEIQKDPTALKDKPNKRRKATALMDPSQIISILDEDESKGKGKMKRKRDDDQGDSPKKRNR